MGRVLDMINEQPDLFEGATVFEDPDFFEAVVGHTEDGRVIYDYDKMIRSYMSYSTGVAYDELEEKLDDDTFQEKYEEAVEWIDYNTLRTIPYMGEKAPIVLFNFE